MTVEFMNFTLSIFTVFTQIIIVIILISLILHTKNKKENFVLRLFGAHALLITFIIALTGTLVSLYYSDIVGFEPCKLCWLQRIVLYPQVLLLGMANYKNDKNIVDYSILLSAVGALIAAFHYSEQMRANPLAPCSAVGYAVSCADSYVQYFGYVTIPLMSLSAFALMIMTMIAYKVCNKKK